MQACLAESLPVRIDARTNLFNTVRADYTPTLVRVNEEKIQELYFPETEFKPMRTGLPGTAPGSQLSTGIAYLLLLNSQNFQFWDMVNGKFVRYAYEDVVGANGLRRAFRKAWGEDATSATFRRALTERGLERLFGPLSQPAARDAIFREMLTGKALEIFAHWLTTTVVTDHKFDVETAQAIADIFPRSYAEPYLKRAQLALAEIAGFCHEMGYEVDCSELTVFADYQVPRVLRAMGVLEYAPELAQKVDSQTLIKASSTEERAIRAATIVAGEKMAKHFRCIPAAVDNFLWTNRARAGTTPFHLTITTAY